MRFLVGRRGLAAVVALGAGWATAARAADPVELRFRFNDPEQPGMRKVLDAFEKQNPGITVKLERVAWKDVRDQFLREAAVGEGPDVVHIAFVNAREMADAGALLPLDKPIAQDPPGAGVADFIATELARGKDGQLYALPWTTDTWAMVYRTDLLAKAGVAALPRTWAELAAASGRLKAAGTGGFGFPAGSASAGSIWFLANFKWWGEGRALVQRSGQDFSVGLGAADVSGAMGYFKRFIDAGETPRSFLAVSDWGDPAILAGLAQGNSGIGIMPPATFREVMGLYARAHPGEKLPFVSGPVPGEAGPGTTHLGGRMLGINANTRHPEASWKLLRFLNTEAVFVHAYPNQFPAQKSLLQHIDFGPEMKGFAEQMQHTRVWGAYGESPAPLTALWNLTGRSFGAALSGQTAVDAAAADYLSQAARMIKTGH